MYNILPTQPIAASKPISPKNEQTNAGVNLQAKVEEYLAELSKNNVNLEIHVGNYTDSSASNLLHQFAYGSHLFISQSFLENMCKNMETFKNGKELIEQTVAELLHPSAQGIVGKGTLLTEKKKTEWSVSLPTKADIEASQLEQLKKMFDMIEKSKKSSDQWKKHYKIKKSASLANSVVGVYGKLSRASSSSQVRGVISTANSKLMQIKSEMRNADKTERQQLQSAATQLQSAIVRSRVKIRQLEHERYIRLQEQKAQAERQLKEAQQASLALKRKKSSRLNKEQAYLQQATITAYMDQQKALKEYLSPTVSAYAMPAGASVPTAPVAPPIAAPNSVSISLPSGATAVMTSSTVSL